MRSTWIAFVLLVCFSLSVAAKDLYKVLGVDKTADQRAIKKAFHKLSLKYHPDKNKAKDAQDKFTEISNAYDILGDEEKRKQYDLHGDEPQGDPFRNHHGNQQRYHHGNQQGYYQGDGRTYHENSGQSYFFTSGGPGAQRFTFSSGGPGGPGHSFYQDSSDSFSGGNPFSGFGGIGGFNVMENLFGFKTANNEGPGTGSSLQKLNAKDFRQKVMNSSETWLLMFGAPGANPSRESSIQELDGFANRMKGIIKVGVLDCGRDKQLCKEHGVTVSRDPRLYVYPWMPKRRSLVEYTGDWTSKEIEKFAVQFLPKLSKRIQGENHQELFDNDDGLFRAVLLTTKKDTSTMWRALSGVFYGRAVFLEKQVNDASDSLAKLFQVKSLPAVVGVLANSDAYILSQGPSKLKIDDLKRLLKELETKNKKVSKQRKIQPDDDVPKLTKANFARLCSKRLLCIIAITKTTSSEQKAMKVLQQLVQKNLQPANRASQEKVVSYGLVDGVKQSSFVKAFGDATLESQDPVLVAYKPRKEKFATHSGAFTSAEAETFVTAALDGELKFEQTRKQPTLS